MILVLIRVRLSGLIYIAFMKGISSTVDSL
jgi:hypothetical protein